MSQRLDHGVPAWERRLAARPHDPAVAAGLVRALLTAGRPADAATLLAPHCDGDAGLLRLHAQALLGCGQRGPAIGALFMAHTAAPDNTGVLGELGDALFSDGNADASLPFLAAAFAADPSAAHAATLSCVLLDLGRGAEALAVTDRALAVDRRSPSVWTNRSIALEGLGRMDDATAAARQALALAPRSAFAQHHLATTLLVQGQLTDEAWRLYEGRLGLNGVKPLPAARRWTGEDMLGGTVLLHAEQGLGDTLQFVRYAPLVAARGARVVLAVQPALVRLLQGTPGVAAVVPAGGVLPEFDTFAPLLSLPGVFGTTRASVPPPSPYAGVAPRKIEGAGLRVGIAWAGSSGFVADAKRSLPEGLLPGVCGIPGVTMFGLQLGAGGRPGIVDLMGGVRDMADTAAVAAGLDLVISVDTAVAHLAATLGKPVWLLSRHRGCWRWLRDRIDSPWYPTVRVFRQTAPNDWADVVAQVRMALIEWAR